MGFDYLNWKLLYDRVLNQLLYQLILSLVLRHYFGMRLPEHLYLWLQTSQLPLFYAGISL